ncbi:MAG: hypothetical protein GQE15_19140 [Archangiaceae bacterium]|nr:hypothetical protein [Archangiaceae bacterium]
MVTLPEDTAFLDAARAAVIASGLMRAPRFEASGRFVEGTLQLDLLNAWHRASLAELIAPKTLVSACSFGRIDLVERAIARHDALDPATIEAAIGAFVVTDLHVACVEQLFAAGVPHHRSHLETWRAESTGSEHDRRLLELLQRA